MKQIASIIGLLVLFVSIQANAQNKSKTKKVTTYTGIDIENRLAKYVEVQLTTDMNMLTDKEKQMLPILFEVAKIIEEMYWVEAYGDKNELMSKIKDKGTKKFIEINYGPWDRLDGNNSFIKEIGDKPLGSNFYPADMTSAEFDALDNEAKNSLYTLILRNEANELVVIPYHEFFKDQNLKAHDLLLEAAALAEDEGLKNYLTLRAEALITDQYQPSDLAWLDMKTNTIDFVVGPIENYEDSRYGYKAAHEAFILIKDKVWSAKLAKYAAFLPELQQSLPVNADYKKEKPGTDSELNAYDVVFYAGDCNAGSKTIAINLPNDEEVHILKGTRKLQLKNAMRAKFDKILLPITDVLIDPSQRENVKFDAFFSNTMFHEVAHGLGIKYLVNNSKISVRDALKEQYSAIEEGKADILGLYMVTYLSEKGELSDMDLLDYYVTFSASIFRSVRFGVASSHGKANMMRFNYIIENGGLIRNEKTGTYFVDFERMKVLVSELAVKILTIQGNGDYDAARSWVEEGAKVGEQLQKDLDRLVKLSIPTDIVYKQGPEMLGL
ncbi:MAG: Zn-dependent hydrolase [Bacteroidetes bacterium]|nr:Zn-dependent hydrolase [Bacteroidota bacterium]MBT3799826.1 Zn-dependent hydrolase [Bacteroidota bacterium]MBT3934459.1 Zn-dependent hydrolase [Bacteroidota bacterium]